MKKLFFLAFICLNSTYLFSQGLLGSKWSKGGDILTSTDWFGSSNAADVIFKSNSVIRFRINSDGKMVFSNNPIIFEGFAGIGSTGLFRYDATGKLIAMPFTSIGSDVLRGDGTFGSIFAAAGWNSFPGITYTSNKVGIGGITTPVQALEVNGNAIFNGSVSATEFKAGDVFGQGRSLSIISGLCMKGYDATVPGSRSEVCGMGNDFYIQSTSGLNKHTILNYGNGGLVGIGTNNPLAKLHVNGSFRVDGEVFYSGTSHFNRISPMIGDTVIRFGDSTLYLNPSTNALYVATPYSALANKGVGVGSYASVGKGIYSTALGHQSRANGDYSNTMGYFTKADANFSMVIGTGISGNYLVNNTSNSLVVGFNSNIPTLYVGPSVGVGTTGNVSIGTTCTTYKLTVEGEIGCRGLWVKQTPWCDYVFKKEYKLRSYQALREYILAYGHLPNVPSQDEITEQDGYSLNDMSKAQMEKIEENTLYILDLNERLVKMEKENEELKAMVKQLLNDKK